MVGTKKENYTEPVYQLFLDDYRNTLSEEERSNAKKVITDGALARSE